MILFYNMIIALNNANVKRKEIIIYKEAKKVIDLTTLSEEEKAVILAKRAYKRAWNAKNKDKVKAINDRFYKKQAEKLASKAQKETV